MKVKIITVNKDGQPDRPLVISTAKPFETDNRVLKPLVGRVVVHPSVQGKSTMVTDIRSGLFIAKAKDEAGVEKALLDRIKEVGDLEFFMKLRGAKTIEQYSEAWKKKA
jgi:hypothetical protein